MKRAFVVPIVTIILSMLVAEHANSYNSVTPSNTQVALAKTSGSVKSSDSIKNPTRSECEAAARISVGIALSFVAACILLYPHDFKKGEGGTLVIVTPDSTEGLKPFGNKE
jgi:hypothetical protein